jgi:aminopeptidase
LDDALLRRYAALIVEVGANVQAGQTVWIVAEPRAAPLARLVAAAAYERGALFVDPWYFDPHVKRIRLERAAEETLDFVPSWYGRRLVDLGAGHGVRISITPQIPPGLLAGVDPARAGRDALPALAENFDVINAKTTNWTVVPWPTPEWARLVHPGVDDDTAMARLWEQLVFVLRLDEPDPAAAWHERLAQLHEAGKRVDAHRFDALRFEGPGTDLTVGLLPTSRFSSETPGMQTVDGIVHAPNLPTEEIATSPDPLRTDGVVTATKPLDVGGTVIRDLRVRFEGGRAVEIEGDGAEALRAHAAKDEGASRLGEVALVDREGRIGKTGTVFYNTLLDENAASHLALGNAYAILVGEEDRGRINTSAIHIDFMIGSDDVAVTGVQADGAEVPVLRGGAWQVGV